MKSFLYLAAFVAAAVLLAPWFTSDDGSEAQAAGEEVTLLPPTQNDSLARATFAGGCFWCMEPPYDEVKGVISTTSGYTGGEERNPTYKEVASGRTSHAEAVRVVYDPEQVSYEELLNIFWHNIDPTTGDRQFCDVGAQYRPALYYHDEEQRRLAEATKERLQASGRFDRIAVEIEPAGDFWVAESYHQDFYQKNPERYYSYRKGCGRDARLKQLWGDVVDERAQLLP